MAKRRPKETQRKPKKLERKAKKREQRLQEKKTELARQESQSPRFIVEREGAPPPLADAVEQTLSRIRAARWRHFGPPLPKLFRTAAKKGFAAAWQMARDEPDIPHEFKHFDFVFSIQLGGMLFATMPPGLLGGYLPFHSMGVQCGRPDDRSVRVRFASMGHARSRHGTIYYPHSRPTVEIDGEPKVIGYSRHAAERLCERTVPDWQTYAGAIDAFDRLNGVGYYEPCRLPDGKPGMAIYELCVPRLVSWSLAEAVLGELDPKKSYRCLVGYCPLGVEGEFASAITLLLPGMAGTPEGELIRRSRLPHERKQWMRSRVQGINLNRLPGGEDFTLPKWFHEQGVPQVIVSGVS